MDIRNRRALRAAASEALAANPGDPRMVVLIYVAISAVSALLVSAVVDVLARQIADLGGLSNMGLRSMLSTAQTVLPLAHTAALWGLHLGYRQSTLRMARQQAAHPQDLKDGFRRYGCLLRSLLLRGGLYFLLGLGASYAASFLFMLTPLSAKFYELVAPMVSDPDTFYTALSTDLELMAQATQAMMPVIPIFLVVFAAVAAPFYYQYRMTDYCILDNPGMGALAAMRESSRMMHLNRVNLFKLDLSFWWFYLGQVLVTVVLYGDKLLPLAGVTLPWTPTVSYYVFYVLALALEGLLYYFCMNRVETTYAAAYDALRPKPQPTQGGAVLGNIFDLAKDYKED